METYEETRRKEQEKKALEAKLQDSIMTDVADLLNFEGILSAQWKAERNHERGYLLSTPVNGQDFTIFLWLDETKQRAETHYSPPKDAHGEHVFVKDLIRYNEADESKITFSYNKAPSKIVSDIVKRCLPAALSYHYRVCDLIQRQVDKMSAARSANIRALNLLKALKQDVTDKLDAKEGASYLIENLQGDITSCHLKIRGNGETLISIDLANGIDSLISLLTKDGAL